MGFALPGPPFVALFTAGPSGPITTVSRQIKTLWNRSFRRSCVQEDDLVRLPEERSSSPAAEDVEASLAPLRELSSLIQSSVGTIEAAYTTSGTSFPSLSSSSSPIGPPACTQTPTVEVATQVLIAACNQLIASVDAPNLRMLSTVMQFHTASALRLAVEAHAAEALRPAGEKGLPVEEIAKFSVVDPNKLARCLRLLANQHIFKEVAPDCFANTRLSLTLDTGKDAGVLACETPAEWYGPNPGVPAMVATCADEMFKASSHMTDVLLDPEIAKSTSLTETAMNRAFDMDASLFAWYASPEEEHRQKRFAIAMSEIPNYQRGFTVLDKVKIPDGGVFVDVGGGVGTQCLEVVKTRKYRAVVQDRPEVIEAAVDFWMTKDKDALESGLVELQPHDFFLPNPVRGAAVYLLSMIIHDWPDKESIRLLQCVAEAANKESKIVLGTTVLPHVCSPDRINLPRVMKHLLPPHPKPLLPTLGNTLPGQFDLQMLIAFNAVERTPTQWIPLVDKAGLKIDEVVPGDPLSCVICSLK